MHSVGFTAEVYKDVTSVSNNVCNFVTKSLICIYNFDFNSVIPHGTRSPSRLGPYHYRGFTITLRRTTPLDEWSARRRDLCPTTHNIHKRQTSMSPEGFEQAIPASEPPKYPRLWRRGHRDRRRLIIDVKVRVNSGHFIREYLPFFDYRLADTIYCIYSLYPAF